MTYAAFRSFARARAAISGCSSLAIGLGSTSDSVFSGVPGLAGVREGRDDGPGKKSDRTDKAEKRQREGPGSLRPRQKPDRRDDEAQADHAGDQ